MLSLSSPFILSKDCKVLSQVAQERKSKEKSSEERGESGRNMVACLTAYPLGSSNSIPTLRADVKFMRNHKMSVFNLN